eukprot:TRINITY_DN7185_c0_g1_i3.p1 TRINITY_DN7185_c0_g1~~TRINITY_DN7185_c0_g1_i3.p1  ORF type:complete len:268 (+),score=42.15 TRINITY_DN7185_c0_g1_i3:73-804(+)
MERTALPLRRRHVGSFAATLLVFGTAALLCGLVFGPSAFLQPALGAAGSSSRQHLMPAAAPHAALQASPRSADVARRAFTTMPIVEPPEDLMSVKQRDHVPSAEHLEYAVVEYSGKQHMITEGSMYDTYFIRAVAGSKVRFNRVLLHKHRGEDGNFKVEVGQPYVDGAYVEVTILEHLKSSDQVVFKHKPKKHYLKRWIVQQKLTRFRVDKIVFDPKDTEVKGVRPFPMWDARPGSDEKYLEA